MITPVLFFGRATEPVLLRVGVGYTDDGDAYEMLARSRSVAPAGTNGEVALCCLYITTLHFDTDVSVWITPILDGEPLPTQRLDLTGVMDSEGERETHEVDLSIPYMVGGVERLRYAPRGTWVEVQIETKYADAETGAAPAAAKQVVESVVLEYEVVRESMEAIPE